MAEAAAERGGVTPFNVIPAGSNAHRHDRGHKQPARTAFTVCDWWVRYTTKPGDIVLDPFSGSGTVPLVATLQGRRAVGIEKEVEYHDIAVQRLDKET